MFPLLRNPGRTNRVYQFTLSIMNARNKKIAVGVAILAVAVPAIGFAAASATGNAGTVAKAFREMRGGSGSTFGEGRGRGPEGMGPQGMMGGEAGILSNEKVRAALAASGVTLPTTDEVKAFQDAMKAARTAESKLSDTDKAGLKAVRDAGQEKIKAIMEETAKSEREYLRSKGVALPTEEAIAKMTETAKKAGEVLRATHPKFAEGKEGRGGFGMMGGKHGMRGGFGGRQSENEGPDAPDSASGTVSQ